jgi:hypothetical protein
VEKRDLVGADVDGIGRVTAGLHGRNQFGCPLVKGLRHVNPIPLTLKLLVELGDAVAQILVPCALIAGRVLVALVVLVPGDKVLDLRGVLRPTSRQGHHQNKHQRQPSQILCFHLVFSF